MTVDNHNIDAATMKVRLLRNGRGQTVRIPKALELRGVNEVELHKASNSIIMTPVRKSWVSFALLPRLEDEPALDRSPVIEPGRISVV